MQGRECDYSGPRYPITSEPLEPCQCRQMPVANCRTCGRPVCEDHALRCEEAHCWDDNAVHCPRCVALVEGMRFCRKHVATWNQEEVA